jgi:hypothetical protein
MTTIATQVRFDDHVEPKYRQFMNRVAREGNIERAQRMGRRLTTVDVRRHERPIDHPGLPAGPLG